MCTSSSCDGAPGDGAASSTPFIATWNGKKFSLENDFLFSKPRTNTSVHYAVAKRMYEENWDQGDKYIIQNEVAPIGNKFVFQIREIEPEISYIDNLIISAFKKEDTNLYFVTSDHKNILTSSQEVFKKTDLHQSAIFNNTADISTHMTMRFEDISGGKAGNPRFIQELEKEDSIEIDAHGLKGEMQPYLLIESKYRDWTIGEIFENRSRVNFAELQTLGNWFRSPVKMLILALIFSLSFVGFYNDKDDETQESILSRSFDMNVARADISGGGGTKSLLVDYFDPASKDFKNVEIIEPRYYQASSYLVKIPREAVCDGKVRLKITATKKHHVTCARMIATDGAEFSPVEVTPLKLTKAYNRRTSADDAAKLQHQDKDYLVTWPGDIVDLEFTDPTNEMGTKNVGFVLEAHGFYTAAPRAVQKQLGDWVSRLDPESAAFLKELHTLNASRKIAINS